MIHTFKKILLVSRPVSWVNTAYPFAAAYLVTGGNRSFILIVATLFFLIPYNLLMYGVNDVFDYESDIKNPRKGGIEGAKEQKDFHSTIMWASLLTPIPFVLLLLFSGTLLTNTVLLFLLFAVLAYSIPVLRFKEVPVLDSITSSVHFVGPMVYALALTGFKAAYMPYVIAFFLWGIASHALGAVQDILPDRAGGISSVATVFGARKTIRLLLSSYLVASLLLIMQDELTAIVGIVSLIYFANAVPYWNISDETSGIVNKGWRRFMWLNLVTGFVITIVLLVNFL